jgi:hypothetical protein
VIGSGAIAYTPSFIKIGSGVQKSMEGFTHRHAHRQGGDLMSLLSCFKNNEGKLTRENGEYGRNVKIIVTGYIHKMNVGVCFVIIYLREKSLNHRML